MLNKRLLNVTTSKSIYIPRIFQIWAVPNRIRKRIIKISK